MLYEWVLDDAAQHCDDCENRAGEQHRFNTWLNLGLPGEEFSTQCGVHCKCTLIEIEE